MKLPTTTRVFFDRDEWVVVGTHFAIDEHVEQNWASNPSVVREFRAARQSLGLENLSEDSLTLPLPSSDKDNIVFAPIGEEEPADGCVLASGDSSPGTRKYHTSPNPLPQYCPCPFPAPVALPKEDSFPEFPEFPSNIIRTGASDVARRWTSIRPSQQRPARLSGQNSSSNMADNVASATAPRPSKNTPDRRSSVSSTRLIEDIIDHADADHRLDGEDDLSEENSLRDHGEKTGDDRDHSGNVDRLGPCSHCAEWLAKKDGASGVDIYWTADTKVVLKELDDREAEDAKSYLPLLWARFVDHPGTFVSRT